MLRACRVDFKESLSLPGLGFLPRKAREIGLPCGMTQLKKRLPKPSRQPLLGELALSLTHFPGIFFICRLYNILPTFPALDRMLSHNSHADTGSALLEFRVLQESQLVKQDSRQSQL